MGGPLPVPQSVVLMCALHKAVVDTSSLLMTCSSQSVDGQLEVGIIPVVSATEYSTNPLALDIAIAYVGSAHTTLSVELESKFCGFRLIHVVFPPIIVFSTNACLTRFA